jgi:AcrR family transcriptional regulator
MTFGSNQEDRRLNQKARTRQAIVDAGRRLLGRGITPTVAQAATEAHVSRATAYRYFPTHDALLVEITGVTPAVVPVEDLVGNLESDDVEERLLTLFDRFNPIVISEETRMRRALLVYLDTWFRAQGDQNAVTGTVREGRRMRWLDEVLRPVSDLPGDEYRRLRAALALTLGIDSIVIMKDVCGLNDHDGLEVLRWAAATLLRAALDEKKSGHAARRPRAAEQSTRTPAGSRRASA